MRFIMMYHVSFVIKMITTSETVGTEQIALQLSRICFYAKKLGKERLKPGL